MLPGSPVFGPFCLLSFPGFIQNRQSLYLFIAYKRSPRRWFPEYPIQAGSWLRRFLRGKYRRKHPKTFLSPLRSYRLHICHFGRRDRLYRRHIHPASLLCFFLERTGDFPKSTQFLLANCRRRANDGHLFSRFAEHKHCPGLESTNRHPSSFDQLREIFSHMYSFQHRHSSQYLAEKEYQSDKKRWV